MKPIEPQVVCLFSALAAVFLLVSSPTQGQKSTGDENRFMIARKFSAEEMDKAKKLMDQYIKKGGDKSDTGSSESDSGDGSESDTGSNDTGASDTGNSDTGGGSTESSGTGSTGSTSSIDAQPMAEPEPSTKKTAPNDLMFAQAHMKLAKRHFGSKNLDRAKSEISQILERVSDYPEARFMRAVIAAKEKDFIEAWRNIEVASKGAPENQKVKDFIDRLQKAYPKPDILPDATPAARQAPTHASELAADALEKLFSDKAVSGKLVAVELASFTEKDGTTMAELKLESSMVLDGAAVKTSLQAILGGAVSEPKTASGGSVIEMEIELPKLPRKNPKPQAVSGVAEFLKGISEETDVAIQNSSETDPDSNKQQSGTYTLAAKGIKSLNDFLRKISPFTLEFTINRFYSAVFAGKSIWKAEVTVVFLTGS